MQASLSLFPNDAGVMGAAHYIRYNRMVDCSKEICVGCCLPDVVLTKLDTLAEETLSNVARPRSPAGNVGCEYTITQYNAGELLLVTLNQLALCLLLLSNMMDCIMFDSSNQHSHVVFRLFETLFAYVLSKDLVCRAYHAGCGIGQLTTASCSNPCSQKDDCWPCTHFPFCFRVHCRGKIPLCLFQQSLSFFVIFLFFWILNMMFYRHTQQTSGRLDYHSQFHSTSHSQTALLLPQHFAPLTVQTFFPLIFVALIIDYYCY